jgi:hypothetical protein
MINSSGIEPFPAAAAAPPAARRSIKHAVLPSPVTSAFSRHEAPTARERRRSAVEPRGRGGARPALASRARVASSAHRQTARQDHAVFHRATVRGGALGAARHRECERECAQRASSKVSLLDRMDECPIAQRPRVGLCIRIGALNVE